MAAVAAVSAVVTASASLYSSYENQQAAASARRSQGRLEKQQRDELAKEAADRDALAAKQAKTGQMFGFGEGSASAFASGFGYGQSANTGFGRSFLTGGA